MTNHTHIVNVLISAAAVIGGVIMVLWIGVAWLLSYSD